MRRMGARLPLDRLKEGMVLTASVTDRSGRLLAKEGDRLDSKVLSRMRAGGVFYAEVVEDEKAAPPPGEDEKLEERIEVVLSRKFQGTEGNSVMNEIRELTKAHLVARRRVPS